MQPFNIVEDDGFRAIIKFAFPFYDLPCRKTICQQLQDQFESTKKRLKGLLMSIPFLSLTSNFGLEHVNLILQ